MERFTFTLQRRLAAHLPAKIAVWLGLAVGICVPYFTLQRVRLFPLREVPQTPLDRFIAFDPGWIWLYLSLGLLVPLAPLLAEGREALTRYARGLALLCAACFAAFLLLPAEGPRPAASEHPVWSFIVSYDRPANSMPSLHAGLVVYSLLFAWRSLRDALRPRARRLTALLGAVWGALILHSTLATKQHWALDLPAGALLALGAHGFVWRAASRVPGGRGAEATTSP